MDRMEERISAPKIVYDNNDKVAHAVSHYLDGLHPSPQRFALRPYNRFLPQFTEWWLIPSNEWPAYRYSKLFFHRFQPAPERTEWFYTGFYVERGLGEQLASLADVKKTHIMHGDWYWHDFIRQAKAGEMDSAVQEVLLNSQRPVVLSMDVYGFNQVPEPDTERQPPYDWIEFVIHSQDGHFRLGQPGSEILAQLNSCVNLSELAQCLEALTELDYFWVNLLIGIRLQYGTEADGSWKAAEIWHRALEPWNSWVR
jgi:hypothetical protein